MNTTDTTSKWAQPTEVSDAQMAFPAQVMDLMPSREECKMALKALPDQGKRWVDLQQRWFYSGLPKMTEFHVAEGVDSELAIRHLQVIQASYEPKHEHKEAAVAYLASLWFTDFDYEGFA
jgi:hypothetical protein